MSPIPITAYPAGTKVKIASLEAGAGAKSRLLALGLIPGTEVLVNSCGSGPCRVRVRDCDLVLGHGLASKVYAVDL